MHLIYLPFADDRRHLNFPPAPERTCGDVASVELMLFVATEDQIAAANKVIKAFELEVFNSLNFPNPALQTHYAAVQAVALEMDEPRIPPDFLRVNEDAVATHGHFAKEFIATVYPDGMEPGVAVKKPAARKRKAVRAQCSGAFLSHGYCRMVTRLALRTTLRTEARRSQWIWTNGDEWPRTVPLARTRFPC